MPETLPADLEEFVRQELGRGVFESRDDLFVQALRVYKDLRSRQAALRGEILASTDEADRGEAVEVTSKT